jgi:transcriptional regulator with GAF, ATPase, and Fis domain
LPTLTAGALEALVHYEWPGNVRELRNVAERLVVRRVGRMLEASDVSREFMPSTHCRRDATAHPAGTIHGDAELYRRLTEDHESFRSVVQGPFIAHDLTRDHVRSVLSRGLRETQGNYRALALLLNMDAGAYRWTMNFVRKNERPSATEARAPGPSAQVA